MKSKSLILLGSLILALSFSSLCWGASSVAGDTVEYDFRSGQAVAKGHVVVTRDKARAESAEADYNTKTGNGKLTGSVVAAQEDAHLTCQTLVIASMGDHLTATGNAVLKKQDKTLRSNIVDYFSQREYAQTGGDWAQLTLDDGSVMDAVQMNYDMKEGLANATGNVRVVSPPRKLTARGDRALYNTKVEDGTIELIGHATATQDGDTVTGNVLRLKGAGGKISEAEGSVKLVYHPRQEPKVEPYAEVVGDQYVPRFEDKPLPYAGEDFRIEYKALA